MMKKIIDFFRSPLFLPVAASMILYAYWLFFIPTKTFFSNWDLRLGILCLMIYFIAIVLGRIFVSSQHYSFLPYIIVVPVSLVGMYFGWLYLFLMFIFDFYQYRPVFIFLAGFILLAVVTYRKIPKQDKRQVIFFLATFPIFAFPVFNFIVYCPTVWATTEFEGYRYYVIEEIWDYPHSDIDFYKCRKLSLQCEILRGMQYGQPEIIIDEEKNEVSLIGYQGLLYTDGSNPRRYTGYESGQLGNNKYYLSETCNNFNYNGRNECESYTFVPYECNLNNKSCDPLPIRIESDYVSYFYWEVDEAKKEIRLLYSDDEILVFTYGEHPQCHVDWCKLLK